MNKSFKERVVCIVLFLVFICLILSGCGGNNKEEKNNANEPETVANTVEDAVEDVADQTEYEDNSSPTDALSVFSSYFDKYGWGSVLEDRLSACAKEAGLKSIDKSSLVTLSNVKDNTSGTYHQYDLILNGGFNGYDAFGNYAGRFEFECDCSITYDMSTDTYVDMNLGVPKVVE